MTVIYTKAAEHDLKEIAQYTQDTWGAAQRRKYLSDLKGTLDLLIHNPRLGRSNEKLFGAMKYKSFGSHYIVYNQTGKEIEVIRIIHQYRDIRRHLGRDRKRSKERVRSR